jgi:hypothetical protein
MTQLKYAFCKTSSWKKKKQMDLNIGMDLRDVGYEDIRLVGVTASVV